MPLLQPVVPQGDKGVGHEIPASGFGLHMVWSWKWGIRAVNALKVEWAILWGSCASGNRLQIPLSPLG